MVITISFIIFVIINTINIAIINTVLFLKLLVHLSYLIIITIVVIACVTVFVDVNACSCQCAYVCVSTYAYVYTLLSSCRQLYMYTCICLPPSIHIRHRNRLTDWRNSFLQPATHYTHHRSLVASLREGDTAPDVARRPLRPFLPRSLGPSVCLRWRSLTGILSGRHGSGPTATSSMALCLRGLGRRGWVFRAIDR